MQKYPILLLLLSNLREYPGLVLRGARAQEGQFPWLIQFHTITPCGGVLVSPDWVLTAAQCLQYKRNSIVLYASGLNGTGSSQSINVKATYIYPKFEAYSKSRDYDHNIALLKLVRAFDMCDASVRLLDIAPVKLDDEYKSCLIFGWQSTVDLSSKVHAKPVQYSKVMPNTCCACMYLNKGNASFKNVFCTMIDDEQGVRACGGNPGSPVVCEDQYQRMVLLGIASWSNFSLDCGGLPAYLGVNFFRSWMWDLIFGSKNMEQGESGAEKKIGVCQRERFSDGVHNHEFPNYTKAADYFEREEREEREEMVYDMSSKSGGKLKNVGNVQNRLLESGKAQIRPEKHEPRFLDNGYTRILAAEGSQRAFNFDAVREREEQLNQYREIGQNLHDRLEEPIAIATQEETHSIVVGKIGKTYAKPVDTFDDFDLTLPDEIEYFDRSAAAMCSLYLDYSTIMILLSCNILKINL